MSIPDFFSTPSIENPPPITEHPPPIEEHLTKNLTQDSSVLSILSDSSDNEAPSRTVRSNPAAFLRERRKTVEHIETVSTDESSVESSDEDDDFIKMLVQRSTRRKPSIPSESEIEEISDDSKESIVSTEREDMDRMNDMAMRKIAHIKLPYFRTVRELHAAGCKFRRR